MHVLQSNLIQRKDLMTNRNILVAVTLFITMGLAAQDAEFTVVDFNGFRNEYLKETPRPVVYNFWATWCKPCVRELPYFKKAASEHPEWDFVLVSLDFPQHYESRLRPFLREHDLGIPVVVLDESDANVFINAIDPTWEGSIPATMIWDDTSIGFVENDFHSYAELITFISQSINSKQ